MNTAFHQTTQQPRPQPQADEETSSTEQNESFVDSVQSNVGFEVGPTLLIGTFVLVVVLIGLLVKFAKPKEEAEAEAPSDNDASNDTEANKQTEATSTAALRQPRKSKKKQTRRQRKNKK